MKKIFVSIMVLMGMFCSANAQDFTKKLRGEIASIAKGCDGQLGVGVINLQTGDTLTYNGNELFPLSQTANLPIGLLTMSIVDRQNGSLDYKVNVEAGELEQNEFSPLRNKYGTQKSQISLNELIAYMVAFDDENATDILTKQVGGMANINTFLEEHGIKGMKIAATQKEQNTSSAKVYDNYSTPYGMCQLLRAFNSGNIINGEAKGYFSNLLMQIPAGVYRIKSGLPEDIRLEHKTGTSAKAKNGLYAATNDVGIFTTDSGRKIGLAVFVKDSKMSTSDRDKVISDVTKAVWNAIMGTK